MKRREVFKALKRKMIVLYMLTAGGVLTVVLAILIADSGNRQDMQNRLLFQELANSACDLVKSSTVISHYQLSEMEIKNRLIIRIGDGGNAFLFPGAWTPETGRELLTERLCARAEADGIFTDRRPVSVAEHKSDVYTVKGEAGDRYLGIAYVTAHQTGYRSLLLLQCVSAGPDKGKREALFYFVIWLAGLLVLYGVSRIFVGRAVKPAQEGQRKQKEFIAAASHELRSPLAVIRSNGAAVAAALGERAAEEEADFLKGIDEECARMSRLIDDMLLLSSLECGTWALEREKVDMDGLLIDFYDRYDTYCREKGFTLRLELGEDILPEVLADKQRLYQVLAILLNNAMSYSCSGDSLILRGYTKKYSFTVFAVMELEDHGPGIPADRKQEIFERFSRMDISRKDKSHFGLGLSVAKELMELQGGGVLLCDTPGGGCTFRLLLPL